MVVNTDPSQVLGFGRQFGSVAVGAHQASSSLLAAHATLDQAAFSGAGGDAVRSFLQGLQVQHQVASEAFDRVASHVPLVAHALEALQTADKAMTQAKAQLDAAAKRQGDAETANTNAASAVSSQERLVHELAMSRTPGASSGLAAAEQHLADLQRALNATARHLTQMQHAYQEAKSTYTRRVHAWEQASRDYDRVLAEFVQVVSEETGKATCGLPSGPLAGVVALNPQTRELQYEVQHWLGSIHDTVTVIAPNVTFQERAVAISNVLKPLFEHLGYETFLLEGGNWYHEFEDWMKNPCGLPPKPPTPPAPPTPPPTHPVPVEKETPAAGDNGVAATAAKVAVGGAAAAAAKSAASDGGGLLDSVGGFVGDAGSFLGQADEDLAPIVGMLG